MSRCAKYLPETGKVHVKREVLSQGDAEEEDERLQRIDATTATIQAKLSALQAERLDTSGYDKSQLGAVVTSESGVLKIMRGMMTAQDAKAETSRQSAVKHGVEPGTAGQPAAGGAGEFSEKLMVDLTSHRTVAIQAMLTQNASVALAVLADKLYGDVLPMGRGNSPVQVSARTSQPALERDGTRLTQSKGASQLRFEGERWQAVVPADSAERLSWLLAQPQDTLIGLIAYCTALTVDLVQRRGGDNAHADAVATALHLDMADWWSVDVDNFLTHVRKPRLRRS
jgi:ParB family chromosome partitioning protein